MRPELSRQPVPRPRPRPAPTVAAPTGSAARPQMPRNRRSKLAKPLLTSLGVVTFFATSSFVVLAISSTGSAKPWDWVRTDPSAAAGRYHACADQGLGALGCMLGGAFQPASAAEATSARKQGQPLISVATVQDPQPSPTPSHDPAVRPPERNVPAAGTRPGPPVARPSPAAVQPIPAAVQPTPEPGDDWP